MPGVDGLTVAELTAQALASADVVGEERFIGQCARDALTQVSGARLAADLVGDPVHRPSSDLGLLGAQSGERVRVVDANPTQVVARVEWLIFESVDARVVAGVRAAGDALSLESVVLVAIAAT